MNNSIKNLLGVAGIIIMLVFATGGGIAVYSYSKSVKPTSFRSFEVSGEGKATAIPDIAKLTFSVITEGGTNVAKLQKENTEKMNKAIVFVKSLNIDQKDIKTQDYNMQPRYQYFRCSEDGACPPSEIVGYTISQSVSVKVRDFEKIGELLSGVVENGANTVSGVLFTIDDPEAPQNEARAEAIAKAKRKAETMAEAGEFRLGRLLSINEGANQPKLLFQERALSADVGLGGAAPAPTIEAGSEEVVVNITLKYEIK